MLFDLALAAATLSMTYSLTSTILPAKVNSGTAS
jgi:hypothetical protein